MKRILILFILLIYFNNNGFSQSSSFLSGSVKDEEGNFLSNVNIKIEEAGISVVTSEEGFFIINDLHSEEYHISFSHTGYKPVTMMVEIKSGENPLDIVLEKTLIETPTIDVTSAFSPSEIRNSSFSITSILPSGLKKMRSGNLASTIENISGVNNLSTGNGIGKPVIRGLTSKSVLIIHDGIKHESQQWGDEHGPEVGLFNIDRIEILRGPASIIYGSDGIGGVINIISQPLQFSAGKDPVYYGTADLNIFSQNSEGAGNLSLGTGFKNFGIKGNLAYRSSGNIHTPEGEFQINIPGGTRIIHGDELFNSKKKEIEGGFSFGFLNRLGIINGSFEHFDREIQIHGDPVEDPLATPNQKIVTSQYEVKGDFHLNENLHLEPVISFQDHSRKEFESKIDKENDLPALNLELKTFQSDARLHHKLYKNISGTIGGSFLLQKNETLAEEKLIPNYNSSGFGIYALEKIFLNNLTISAGARFDKKDLDIKYTVFEESLKGSPEKFVSPRTFNFNSFTGSAGFVFKVKEFADIFGNIGSGWRPPSEFELYADGVHEGTGRFEIGLITQDSSLIPVSEKSLNFDLGLRMRFKKFAADASVYFNTINDFIYPSPTGETDPESGYPVFNIEQGRAQFYGFEYNIQLHPAEWLLFTVQGDYVHSENSESKNPIPLTPPAKIIIDIKFQKQNIGSLNNPYINFSAKIVSAQNRVDPLEVRTKGYILLSAGIGFDKILSNIIPSVDFSVSNLLDTKYVDHLSRYRYYAMNPGRSFNLKISIPFSFE